VFSLEANDKKWENQSRLCVGGGGEGDRTRGSVLAYRKRTSFYLGNGGREWADVR